MTSGLQNYGIHSSPPQSFPSGQLTNPSVPISCGSEMRAHEQDVVAMTMKLTRDRHPSILYALLNVGPSASPNLGHSECPMEEDTSYCYGQLSADYRTRSDSFNSVGGHGGTVLSRTPSGNSLVGSVTRPDTDPWMQSEVLVEAARTRLVGLSTNSDQLLLTAEARNRSWSQPGTPPSPTVLPEPRRKYSMGSRLAQLQPTKAEPAPVDLSCKRPRHTNAVLTEDSTDSSHSILKSILSTVPSRERSHTLSVCGTRSLGFTRRQHVTLAKKTVFPVSARIAEQLKRAIEFARSLHEFCALPVADQVALLAGALPRLLLLYMAEANLQFAVTPVHVSGSNSQLASEVTSAVQPSGSMSGVDMPTMPFVESVQNFIRKCQSLQISPNEYFYMRMITLFHSGTANGTLERADIADRIGAEARQDLQDFSRHYRPSERLRYSTLLLSIHTVFGINCGMLAALFCRQLPGIGGIADFAEYVSRELRVDRSTE